MKVLIMGYVWPEVTSSAAGLRDWNLVNYFLKQNWKVLYSSQAKENEFTKKLVDSGVTTVRHAPNDNRFNTWISHEQPDFVVFDRFVTEEQFGWRVRDNFPPCVQILDTQDLHFLRKQRQQAREQGKYSLDEIAKGTIPLQSETALRELASIYRSDCTILISDFEMHLLREVYNVPASSLHLCRLSYRPPEKFIPFEKRKKDFCMIGNFRHPPNVDATLWMKNEIWPLIRKKLPEAEVDIYGAYPSRENVKLSNADDGFNVKGPVKDHLKMLKKYKLNLAPLRFGAGIKGKISDGWYCGTPVVTTPIGAEGMAENFPFGGEVSTFSKSESSIRSGDACVGDSLFAAQDFATRAVSLYLDNKKWQESQSRGGDIINNLYSEDLNGRALINRMLHTKENLESIRSSNMIGSILNYQLNRGSKYFSLWIEEKNNNKNERK